MSDTMVRARVDPELKDETDKIFSELGISTTDAIRMFLAQVKLRRLATLADQFAARDALPGLGRFLVRLERHVLPGVITVVFDQLGVVALDRWVRWALVRIDFDVAHDVLRIRTI